MTAIANPTPLTNEQLNAQLDCFKEERFTEAMIQSVHDDLDRFDGTNIESFCRGIEMVQNLPSKHATLLDVGCGVGTYGLLFNRWTDRHVCYTGCDFSPAMLAAAKELMPGCPFHQADARQLPFADNSFDVVWVSALLEHVPEFDQIIAEAARVSREYILLHRLFLTEGPTVTEIVKTKAGEYPYEGWTYPRVIRNIQEFETIAARHGQVVVRQPWVFDKSRKQLLQQHSWTLKKVA